VKRNFSGAPPPPGRGGEQSLQLLNSRPLRFGDGRTDGSEVRASRVVLAVGHSARDMYRRLLARGVRITAKEFAMGFRVEHPQALIDRLQLGALADLVLRGKVRRSQQRGRPEMRILCMAAKHGPNALFCMPNTTKCILLVSVMLGDGQRIAADGVRVHDNA
jgi:hypothetical protein